MKFIISLLLLICLTTQAGAEITLFVSCDNVTKTSIDQLRASDLQFTIEGDPYVYFITLWLTPEDAQKYNKIAAQSIITGINPDGTFVINDPLLLLTPSETITSDLPYQTSINSRQLILFTKTKEKALEVTQKVCSQITPKVFYMYDYLEEQRVKEKQN